MEKFSIVVEAPPELNEAGQESKLRAVFDMTDDACDCCAKGMVICQMFNHKTEDSFLIQGAFVRQDIAEKIIKLIEEG